MAFYPAHCDNNCKGCVMNNGCGWCLFYDTPLNSYASITYSANTTLNENKNEESYDKRRN